MKGLGLTGAGLGAAAATLPVYHDLDELMASPTAVKGRAWWVKEVDEPTVDIDWSLMERHHGGHSTQSSVVNARYAGGADAYNAITRPEADTNEYRMKQNEAGYRPRDMALSSANGGVRKQSAEQKFGGYTSATSPEKLGVPKWTGTPEEGFKMLRAAMVFFGIADIATAEINEHHKKLIGLTGDNISVSYYPPNWPPPTTVTKPVNFGSGFAFDSSTGITTIPSSGLYSITYTVPQDAELNRFRPTVLGQVGQTRYRLREVPRTCVQSFITGIGYESMIDDPYRAIPSNAGAVLGGLSENSRHSIMSISPEYGAFGGYFDMLTTLPVEHTKPIDAGIWRFCQTCGICAEGCPSGSIEMKDSGREPSFDVYPSKTSTNEPPLPGMRAEGEWHKLGRKTYWTDMPTCQLWVRGLGGTEIGGGRCLRCWGNCVFNSANSAGIHDFVRATAATTGIFNGFFANMHKTFGYGLKEGEEIEEWWNMSLPAYGFDSTKFAKHMGY
jgi:reductive dehalogenase